MTAQQTAAAAQALHARFEQHREVRFAAADRAREIVIRSNIFNVRTFIDWSRLWIHISFKHIFFNMYFTAFKYSCIKS